MVIDYVMGNMELKDKVLEMRIGDKLDSDYQPVEITMRGERGEEKIERRRKM